MRLFIFCPAARGLIDSMPAGGAAFKSIATFRFWILCRTSWGMSSMPAAPEAMSRFVLWFATSKSDSSDAVTTGVMAF